MTVHRVRYLHLRPEHEVVVTLLDSMNFLWEAEATAVPNIICPQVESRKAGRPAPRRQQISVKVVTVMPYLAGEAYGHSLPWLCISPIQLEILNKM